MISVVIYGRNDPYGYNLHKRAVISLNAIAVTLTHPGDEIIFVDYNTPDDNPTFIEAVADTLTPECRKILRIIRVRPEFHEKYFGGRTHLNCLEPIARNIAVRRSNPRNKWILSSNTDMVFVPRDKTKSLSDVCATLPPKLYELPRFEVPESMWESMDRTDGARIVRQMYEWSNALHLHEITFSYRELIYDGPGDFQLIPRDDLFKLHGFEEQMILGWHVDSNICKRFYLLYGETGTLIDQVHAYHCDHTRTASTAHKAFAPQNNWRRFVMNVIRPDIPEQAENWGYPAIEFEEYSPDQSPTQTYVPLMKSLLKQPKDDYYEETYTSKFTDKAGYAPEHVLPYITTLLSTHKKDLTCGYCGRDPKMFGLFVQAWKQFGFVGKIFLIDAAEDLKPLQAMGKTVMGYVPEILTIENAADNAGLLVFDAGNLEAQEYGQRISVETWKRYVSFAFGTAARADQKGLRQGKHSNRKYIIINAINTELEAYANKYLAATHTPFGSHIRHGYVVT